MYLQKKLLDHRCKRSDSQGGFLPGAALFLHAPVPTPKIACSDDLDAAARQVCVRCPQCSHRFQLLDSLAVTAATASPETRTVAPSASASVSPEQAGNSGDSKRQPSKPVEAHKQQDSSPSTQAYLKHPTSSASASPPPISPPPPPADQLTSEVVRNYQITNTSIEQLERVIMDKADRRIRKIAASSGCSIDLRSELPAGRFGIAKNYCVLRARAEANLDSCRCMLVRQMGWNLAIRLA